MRRGVWRNSKESSHSTKPTNADLDFRRGEVVFRRVARAKNRTGSEHLGKSAKEWKSKTEEQGKPHIAPLQCNMSYLRFGVK